MMSYKPDKSMITFQDMIFMILELKGGSMGILGDLYYPRGILTNLTLIKAIITW